MILKLLFLLICSLGHFVLVCEAQKNEIFVPGNFTIVAYFAVHRRNESGGCGAIQEVAGLQRVEVALQTIEQINTSESHCKIGILIRDTCEKDDFGGILKNLGTIVGVIGPATSEETLKFRNQRLNCTFRKAFHIGYAATSTNLTKEYQKGHENFTRVVPSDEHQVQVIIDIIKKITSSRKQFIGVNIIGSPNIYGQGGIDEFKKAAKNNGVSINKEKIVPYNSTSEEFKNILNNTANITQIIVCFCDGDSLRDLLLTAKKMNVSNKFILIASDGWSERDDVLRDVENEADGNYFINIKSDKYNITFDHKYTRLRNTSQEAGISWINELQKKYNCTFNRTDTSIKQCSGIENFQNHFQDTKLPFVKQSIEEIVHHLDKATHQKGICSFNFTSQTSEQQGVNSEPIARNYRYEILQCRKDGGKTKFVLVGDWKNGSLSWNSETRCIDKEKDFIPLHRIDTMVCLCITLLGTTLTIFTALVFYIKRRTPIVKLAETHLSGIIFVGMLLAYSCTLFNLMIPSYVTCTLLKFLPSISLTMIYGSLLIKINRIAWALSATKKRVPKLKIKYLSVKFWVFVSCIFIMVNLIICSVVYSIEKDYLWNGKSYFQCSQGEEKIKVFCPKESLTVFFIQHSVNAFLLVYCTLCAFSTRNLPKNFKETKWIYMSCGCTAFAWVLFIVFFSDTSTAETWKTKPISLSMVLSSSALITLVFMYFPKLYIILLHPKRNHRAYYSTITVGRCWYEHTPRITADAALVNMDSTAAGEFKMKKIENVKKNIKRRNSI